MKKQEMIQILCRALNTREHIKLEEGQWVFEALYNPPVPGFEMRSFHLALSDDFGFAVALSIHATKQRKANILKLGEMFDDALVKFKTLSGRIGRGQGEPWEDETVEQRQERLDDLARLSQTIWGSAEGIESCIEVPQTLLFGA